MMTKDDKSYEDGYHDGDRNGYRNGKQDQMNKQHAEFRKWIMLAFATALAAAVAMLANIWNKP